jgi:hypothetical protein
MSTRQQKLSFQILAACSAAAACYHVLGTWGLLADDQTPVWRHALFVTIDLFGAWYLLRRPLLLLPCFLALVAQQYGSHGSRLVLWWTIDGRVDLLSIGTLLALNIAAVLLVLDARDRSPRVRAIVCPFSHA